MDSLWPFIRDMRGPTVLIWLCLGCWCGAIHGLNVDTDSAFWLWITSILLVFFMGSLAMTLGRSSAVIWFGAAFCGLSAGTGLGTSHVMGHSGQEFNAKAWIQFECIQASKRKYGDHEQQVVSPDGVRWLLVSNEPVQLGWSGLALCSFQSWRPFTEPWGFDAARHYKGKGIHHKAKADQVVQWPGHGQMSHFHRTLARQTRRAKDRLGQGHGSGWLKGLVTGDKSAMSSSVKKAFSAIGLGHLTAVSGFHVGLVSGAFLFILTLVFGARVWNALLVIPGVWLYIMACGAPPSAVRAGIMASALAIGHAAGRKTDGLTMLSLAGLILLARFPFVAVDVGAQLSFLAAAGILWWHRGQSMSSAKNKPSKWRAMLAIPWVATAFTAPVAWPVFGHFPLAFLPSNLVASPLCFLFMLGSAIQCLLPEPWAQEFGPFLFQSASVFVSGVEWFAAFCPPARLPMDHGMLRLSGWVLLSFTFLAVAMKSRFKIPAAGCVMACALLRWQAGMEMEPRRCELSSGDVVVTSGGKSAVFESEIRDDAAPLKWKTRSFQERVSSGPPDSVTWFGPHLGWTSFAVQVRTEKDTIVWFTSPP